MLCSLTSSWSSSFFSWRRLLSNFSPCTSLSLCRVGEQEERGRREGYKRRGGGGKGTRGEGEEGRVQEERGGGEGRVQEEILDI